MLTSEDRAERAEAAEVVRILDAHDKLIYSGKGVPAPEAIRDNSRIRVEVRELAACVAQAEQERDAALAVIEQVQGIAEAYVDDGYKPGRTIWSIKDALATSPPDALHAHNAKLVTEFMEQPEFKAMLDGVRREAAAVALEDFAAELRARYPEDVFRPLADKDHKSVNDALAGRAERTHITRDAVSADVMRRAAAQADERATEIRQAGVADA